MKLYIFISILFSIALLGCIRDDIVLDEVSPELRITTNVDSIVVDSVFQFEATYFNNVGMEETVEIQWQSSNPSVASIDMQGLVTTHELGMAYIIISYNSGKKILKDSLKVYVANSTSMGAMERMGTIETTSSYTLEGDFVVRQEGNNLVIEIAENYKASSSLPGLYVYLSNNAATTVGAYEIGAVQVFSGAHTYTVPNVGLNDYDVLLYFCKPFNVKVGDGDIE